MTDDPSHTEPLQAEVALYRQLLDRTLQVTMAQGLGEIANTLVDGLIEVSGARRGYLGTPDGAAWRLLAARSRDREDLAEPIRRISAALVAEALASGEPARHATDGVVEVCLPIRANGRVHGFLYLEQPGDLCPCDDAALSALNRWLPLVSRCTDCAARRTEDPEILHVETRHPAYRADLHELARIATFDAPILLSGETGTGKSFLARQVHESSRRAGRPFIHVNCGAIPEALLDAELFGAEAGAFTGARARRIGRFEAADGGTLFFDELDSLPAASQVKLLVALQDRFVTRLGSNAPVPVDARIIGAVSRDPHRLVQEGRLREDLFYRLALFTMRVPPLRERPEDVPLLARTILERSRVRYGLPEIRLSPSAEQALIRHPWPGNVRELENVLDRGALLAEGGVIRHLPLESTPPTAPRPARGVVPLLQEAASQLAGAMEARPELRILSLAEAFPGAVLVALANRLGGREAAFNLLGLDDQVRARNHHRVFRREFARLQALAARLGEPVAGELAPEER